MSAAGIVTAKYRRKKFFVFIAVFLSCLSGLLIGEAVFTIFAYVRYGTFSVRELLKNEKNNLFITELVDEKEAFTYNDTLFPHPYLAHVHRKNRGMHVNNIGLFGRDYPFEKSKDEFVILITGGSVAANFAQMQKDGVKYLEEMLNERYDFDGKKVVVLNGGDGAWKQPQQIILFLLFADVIDAVITLDGFNEHYMLKKPFWVRLEYPSMNFHHANPATKFGYKYLLGAWVTSNLYVYSKNNWIISNSRLAYFLTKAIRQLIQKMAEKKLSTGSSNETSVEKIFEINRDWDSDRQWQFNMGLYKKYIRMMFWVANQMNIKAAFFIQPAPAIGKKLTEEEKSVVGDLSYRDLYLDMTEELLVRASPRGYPSIQPSQCV